MLTNVLQSLVTRAEIYDPETGEPRHPLLARREENNVLMLVVTGDRGLAGAFNTNILKTTMNFLASKSGKNVDLETIGRKGRDFLRRRYPYVTEKPGENGRAGPVEIIGEKVGIFAKLSHEDAAEIAERAIERYSKGEIDAVYIAFNEFKSVIAQRLVVEQILPVREIGRDEVMQAQAMTEEERKRAGEAARTAGVSTAEAETHEIDERAAHFATAQVDYIYEQPAAELFTSLLPKYVGIQIFRALLESIAAEHAARMTAMDSATSNASDMIDSLTLMMNRLRQARITKEIIEVVSGAAAAQ